MLVFKREKLRFPDSFVSVERKTIRALVETFEHREGDVIIIGTAEDWVKAEMGARAAVQTLL